MRLQKTSKSEPVGLGDLWRRSPGPGCHRGSWEPAVDFRRRKESFFRFKMQVTF